MTFAISGIDITPYIAYQGLKWQRSDVDGPNAGRLMTGEMQRDRIATKIRWDVTCRPLTTEEQSLILRLIEPEFVTLTYTDIVNNEVVTGEFYSNNFPTSFCMIKNGVEYWNGLTFPLIQR